MVYLETIRTSAHVWFSAERGGSGFGYKYAQTSPSHMAKKRSSWVRADGLGAGLGMASWGLVVFLWRVQLEVSQAFYTELFLVQ